MHGFFNLFISINCRTCFRQFLRPSSRAQTTNTASGIVKSILLPAAIVDEVELRSISSTIAAGSSIGLTILDAVFTVSCY
jgi:hypothetical protein